MTDVAAVDAEAPVVERAPCMCSCGRTPKSRKARFLPGHDAQLKASLYVVIRDEAADENTKQVARDRLDAMGWPQPAPKRARQPKPETNGGGEINPEAIAPVNGADL